MRRVRAGFRRLSAGQPTPRPSTSDGPVRSRRMRYAGLGRGELPYGALLVLWDAFRVVGDDRGVTVCDVEGRMADNRPDKSLHSRLRKFGRFAMRIGKH